MKSAATQKTSSVPPDPPATLQAAVRRLIGVGLPMEDPIWLSRPTDSSRLVERYREGRHLSCGKASRGAEADDAEPSTRGAARPDEHVTALRGLFGRLLTQESVF